ncbi:MAG: hypothetical protein ABIU77_15270 [Ferruginibacter sp.]
MSTDFFIAPGIIYSSGVASKQDHYWIDSYEYVYTTHSLQQYRYVVLGNDDDKVNVQIEIDYTKIDRRWYMPVGYFSKKIIMNDYTT